MIKGIRVAKLLPDLNILVFITLPPCIYIYIYPKMEYIKHYFMVKYAPPIDYPF